MATDINNINGWIDLESYKYKYTSPFQVLNDTEFIAAPSLSTFQSGPGLLSYNIKTNKWNVHCAYPSDLQTSNNTIAIDYKTKKIYLYNHEGTLVIFDPTNKNINKRCYVKKGLVRCGSYPGSIVIDSQYHLICGDSNKNHFIWNTTKNDFDQIHEFKHCGSGISHFGLVYVSSRRELLLFGAWYSHVYSNSIWCYNRDSMKWKMIPNISLPYKKYLRFGYTLTIDEKYILIFGGAYQEKNRKYSSNIYVWDLHNMTIKKSTVICPQKDTYYAVIMSGSGVNEKVLVDGYIRKNCSIFLPADMIKIIKKWYSSENIHLISRANDSHGHKAHWKLPVLKIFNGLHL